MDKIFLERVGCRMGMVVAILSFQIRVHLIRLTHAEVKSSFYNLNCLLTTIIHRLLKFNCIIVWHIVNSFMFKYHKFQLNLFTTLNS